MTTDRITLNLTEQDNRLLTSARAEDGLPATERVRAGLQLWARDQTFRHRIDRLAADLRHGRLTEPVVERPVKVTVVLGQDLRRELAYARATDGLPATERIRAALQLWSQETDIRERIDQLAGELRRGRYARTTMPAAVHPR